MVAALWASVVSDNVQPHGYLQRDEEFHVLRRNRYSRLWNSRTDVFGKWPNLSEKSGSKLQRSTATAVSSSTRRYGLRYTRGDRVTAILHPVGQSTVDVFAASVSALQISFSCISFSLFASTSSFATVTVKWISTVFRPRIYRQTFSRRRQRVRVMYDAVQLQNVS